jgi:hypothetical protein
MKWDRVDVNVPLVSRAINVKLRLIFVFLIRVNTVDHVPPSPMDISVFVHGDTQVPSVRPIQMNALPLRVRLIRHVWMRSIRFDVSVRVRTLAPCVKITTCASNGINRVKTMVPVMSLDPMCMNVIVEEITVVRIVQSILATSVYRIRAPMAPHVIMH